jgi:hypothetical protein
MVCCCGKLQSSSIALKSITAEKRRLNLKALQGYAVVRLGNGIELQYEVFSSIIKAIHQ